MEIKEYIAKISEIYNSKMENEKEIERLINNRESFDKEILKVTQKLMQENSKGKINE